MLKTGVCSVTFRKFDVETVIRLTADAGLDGIEWGSDVHVPMGDPAWAAKVRQMTVDAGLEVLGLGSYFRCDNADDIRKHDRHYNGKRGNYDKRDAHAALIIA